MIAGLPFATWVLMVASVVPGLLLVTIAYRAHRDDAAALSSQQDNDADTTDAASGN